MSENKTDNHNLQKKIVLAFKTFLRNHIIVFCCKEEVN